MRPLRPLPLLTLAALLAASGLARAAEDAYTGHSTGLTLSYQFGSSSSKRPVGLSIGPLGKLREEDGFQPMLLQLPLINVPLAGQGQPSLGPVDMVSDVVKMFGEKEPR